jgi:hypothetical protein
MTNEDGKPLESENGKLRQVTLQPGVDPRAVAASLTRSKKTGVRGFGGPIHYRDEGWR